MSQIKVFVVNLKRSKDRRERIQKLLTPLNIQYEIFEATDGNLLSEKEYQTIRERGKNILLKYPGRDLMNRGEIGCALSHLRLYQKIVKENLDYACILEDDIAINDVENLQYCLNKENLLSLKKKWDFIYLYCDYFIDRKYYYWYRLFDSPNNLGMKWGGEKIKENLYVKKLAVLTFWSTAAYIINQKVAKTFLADGWPVKKLADVLTGSSEYLGLKQYIITPMPLSPDEKIKGTIPHDIKIPKNKKPLKLVNKIKSIKKFNWKNYFTKLIKFSPVYPFLFIAIFFLRKTGVLSLKRIVKRNIYYD